MKPQVLIVVVLVLTPPVLALTLAGRARGPAASSPDDAGLPERLAALLDEADKLPTSLETDTTNNTARPLSQAEQMGRLAHEQPVRFVAECLRRYRHDKVNGYALTMFKEERIDGKVQKPELMRVLFREQPFSVSLQWLEGARRAELAVYVDGENAGRMLVRPSKSMFAFPGSRWAAIKAGRLGDDGVAAVDVDGDDARQSGRYPIREFGMFKALERLLADWEAAQKNNALHVEYLGEQVVPETGGRTCYVLHRTNFDKPERDGVTEQVLYIDRENWLQVGAVAKGPHGLIGTYYYRDIQINPDFTAKQFQRESVRP